MSGETEKEVSGWTTDTLHSHIIRLIAANDDRYQERFDGQQQALKDALVGQEKAVGAALDAAKEAVTKAEISSDKRFESVNEFRATLSDQARDFLPRKEYESRHEALMNRIDLLEKKADKQAGQSIASSTIIGYIIGGLGIVVAIAGVLIAIR